MLQHRRRGGELAVTAGAGATIAAVGASRVLLGAHWFTDVVMGWTTGLGWATAVITAYRLHLATDHERKIAVTTPHVSVQLHSVYKPLEADLDGTLSKLAEIGYPQRRSVRLRPPRP